jgi:5-hydroxyisourate hydrolase
VWEKRTLLKPVNDNEDGRTDEPLIRQGKFERRTYEVVFHVGEYFGRTEILDPPFLDGVPIRFGDVKPQAHYHIPLLTSPWSYGTYRGNCGMKSATIPERGEAGNLVGCHGQPGRAPPRRGASEGITACKS